MPLKLFFKLLPWIISGGLIIKKGEDFAKEEYETIFDYPQGPTEDGQNLGDYENWKTIDKFNYTIKKMDFKTWTIILSSIFLSTQILKIYSNFQK